MRYLFCLIMPVSLLASCALAGTLPHYQVPGQYGISQAELPPTATSAAEAILPNEDPLRKLRASIEKASGDAPKSLRPKEDRKRQANQPWKW